MAIKEFFAYREQARTPRGLKGRRIIVLLREAESRNHSRIPLRAKGTEIFSRTLAHREANPPSGYILDHNRIRLGEGRIAFERAKDAIKQWKMFDMAWLELCWPNTPIKAGSTVAIAVSHLGFWSLNAARIVYTVEEQRGVLERYGFAYGTLGNHAEMGEERFTVEFHPGDETVWYDLYAFSRPHPLALMVFPYTRTLQKKFASDSKMAMQKAVRGAAPARD